MCRPRSPGRQRLVGEASRSSEAMISPRIDWDGPGVQYEWDHLLHGSAADQIIMTEPPALRVVPDEEVSGLWLWHGAPPDQQQRQRVSRRGVRRLSRGTLWVRIGAALIVAGLSALAASVLIAARLTEPAGPWASSPATAAIATSTSLPPAADTPASPAAVAAAPQSVSAQESHPVAIKPGVYLQCVSPVLNDVRIDKPWHHAGFDQGLA